MPPDASPAPAQSQKLVIGAMAGGLLLLAGIVAGVFLFRGKPAEPPDSRFDRQLARVLEHAARIFCEKGYEGASMRDLSRAAGMSLAG